MSLTVKSETDEAVFPWTDKKASDMQDNVVVKGNTISGELKFIEGGLSPSGPLSGDGYFLALKWSDPDETATSLLVGLIPSASGMDLIEAIDDTDRNGVFKISDPENQVFKLISSNSEHTNEQTFSLRGLKFEVAPTV